MADNVTLNAGSGGAVIATDDDGTAQHQYVKVEFGADNTFTKVTSSVGLPVGDAGGSLTVDAPVATPVFVRLSDGSSAISTLPVSAASLPLPSGASTAAKQPALGTAGSASTDVLTVQGITSMTPLLATITFASAQAVTQSGTWNITNISGTVSLPTGASTAAKQPALGTAGSASTDVITVQGITSMTPLLATITFASAQAVTQSGTWDIGTVTTVTTVSTVTNLSQMSGAAISMGTGTRDSGTQRVTIATNDVVPASQSGTWTVQPGNTPNTSAWLVQDVPATSGGLSKFHLVAAASDNATSVKASAGQVYSITAFNLNASPRYLKFHNTASTPTAGSGVTDTFMLPGNTAGAGLVINFDKGIAFSTGIGITIVTGIADSNTTAVAASEIVINIYYK